MPDPDAVQVRRLVVQYWTEDRIKSVREIQRLLKAAGYNRTRRSIELIVREIRDKVIQWEDEDIRAERVLQLEELDAQIDHAKRVQKEAWDAWQKSKQERAEAKVKSYPEYLEDGTIRQTIKEQEHKRVQQNGDPRFLKIALEASATIKEMLADKRTLLNMDVHKIAFTDPTGTQSVGLPLQNINDAIAEVRRMEAQMQFEAMMGMDKDAAGNDAGH